MTNVPVDSPASAHVVGGAKVQVVRPLGVGHKEVIAQSMRPLQSDPLPAAGYVNLGVIDRSVVRLRGAMRVKEEFCLAARVVVVKQACVEAEVAERLLVAAIEIHLQIAARV